LDNELVITGDGSHSLRSNKFAVPYHSTHGAVQESRHVFIDAGLLPLIDAGQKNIRIIEMGLGTGLNVLLVWQLAIKHPEINFVYTSHEQFPVSIQVAERLNYPKVLKFDGDDFLKLHQLSWGEAHQLQDNFSFTKVNGDFKANIANLPTAELADVLFYDAFAPVSQPELWMPETMALCYNATKQGGVFVTYCAKGQFKRDLRSVGYTVEPLPGPPGKREMTRGRRGIK
jgi:tRNA U34 5-methylaminomethyl-2-thiouridine-forming methyltransferase MnmC